MDAPRYTIGCFNDKRELIETLKVPPGTTWIRLDMPLGLKQTIVLPQVIDDIGEPNG